MMKRFFILMIVSCMLLVGCSNDTTETSITVPKCEVCHQTNTSRDWKLVSVIMITAHNSYCYECRYCGNVIETDKPIIRECFQK